MSKTSPFHNGYIRRCRRCEELFRTTSKHSKICNKCSRKRGGGSYGI